MKKILAIVLAVMMLASVLSLNVFAADNYAWQFNSNSGNYLYIDGYGDQPCILEFDFRFDNGGDPYRINHWVGNGGIEIQPSQGVIGVGSTTLTRQFSAATWYHVKFDGSAGSGTAIYLDGTLIGNVGTTVTSYQCLGMVMVTIDNFVMTVNGNDVIDDDFQDKDFDGVNSDTNGTWVIANDLIQVCDHTWDAGVTVNGVTTYTCTKCGATRTEGEPIHTHTWDAGVIQGNVIVYTCTGCGQTRTEAAPNPDDMGWWLRIDGYAHIIKNVDRCDGPYEQNCGYVDFDMIMLPGDNGHCQIRFFDSYEGSTRTYLEDNYLGYHYTYTEAEGGMSWNWGPMTIDNVRHIRYAYTDEDVKLYVDGSHVYTNNYGCTPAMHGLVFYVESGSAIIDNVVFTDTRGNTMYSINFESSTGDNDGSYTRIHLGDCANGNHVAANTSNIGLAPTCTQDGYRYWPCVVCGMEAARETISKLGHNFGTYAQGATTVAATASTDGVKTWTCSRCSAATATGVIPKTSSYTGTILSFDDSSDANVTKYVLGGFSIEAGVDEHDGLEYPGDVNMTVNGVSYVNEYTTANYHQFADVPTTGYTVSYDFRLDEIFDTNDTEGYGHTMYFWVGGENNVANNIGYDFEGGEFFAMPSSGSNYEPVTNAVALQAHKWYNITFKYYSNRDTYEAYAKLYLNGQEVLCFDDDDASFELPYNAGTQYFPLLFRTFGVKADYTNWTIGDVNFMWTTPRTPVDDVQPCVHQWGAWSIVTPAQVGVAGLKTRTCALCGETESEVIPPLDPTPVVPGDANGDGVVNIKDVKAAKAYIVGDGDVNIANADLNGDGRVDARDLKLIKQLVADA